MKELNLVKEYGSENYIRMLSSKHDLMRYINFMDGFQFGDKQNEWGSVDDFGMVYIITDITNNRFMSLEEGVTRKSFKEQHGMSISEALQYAVAIYYQDAYDSVVWVHPHYIEDYKEQYGEIIPLSKLSKEEFFDVIWDPYQLPAELYREYTQRMIVEGNTQELRDKMINEYYYSIHPELLNANPDEIEFRGTHTTN